MGLFKKKKDEFWQREFLSFEDRMEEMRKSLEELRGSEIMVLTKRPDENTFSYAIEVEGYNTKPDERVIRGRESDAQDFGYDKCPYCGMYGAGDVLTCLCGYKFKNF